MHDTEFTPLLTTTDWNDEWKMLQIARRHADDASFWDERSATYPVKHGSQAGYVERFLELADIRPGETVLDMGCGTGALATPLALAGCPVIACDFSRGMLDKMRSDQATLDVDGVDARLLSWTDNWNEAGLGQGCVDVAIASRSIATSDLQDALMKLHSVARRRVCITLPCGPSPRIDEELLAAIGLERRLGRDFVYAFNILAANGIKPQVDYIESNRAEFFESRDAALAGFSEIAANAAEGFASPEEIALIPEKLASWLEENLIIDEAGCHLRKTRRITWAFISWDQ